MAHMQVKIPLRSLLLCINMSSIYAYVTIGRCAIEDNQRMSVVGDQLMVGHECELYTDKSFVIGC